MTTWINEGVKTPCMFESDWSRIYALTQHVSLMCNVLAVRIKMHLHFIFKDKQTFSIEFDGVSLASASSLATILSKKITTTKINKNKQRTNNSIGRLWCFFHFLHNVFATCPLWHSVVFFSREKVEQNFFFYFQTFYRGTISSDWSVFCWHWCCSLLQLSTAEVVIFSSRNTWIFAIQSKPSLRNWLEISLAHRTEVQSKVFWTRHSAA